MYSKATKDDDNKMVEGWQKDADGILIFVSPCCLNPYYLVHELEDLCRPVYSLPQLLHSFPSPSET